MPACWSCDAASTRSRVVIESVLRAREEALGGPYTTYRCHACGTENGALQNQAGQWMLYPLEGLDDPSLIDWISPRTSREHLRAAHEWWTRRRGDVERFRRSEGAPRTPRPPESTGRARPHSERPPPRQPPPGASEQRARNSPPPEPPRPTRSLEQRSAEELLGVGPDADEQTIRTAYRRALKLCHPDRVANLDPEIQELAHRKSKALRRAFEHLLGET